MSKIATSRVRVIEGYELHLAIPHGGKHPKRLRVAREPSGTVHGPTAPLYSTSPLGKFEGSDGCIRNALYLSDGHVHRNDDQDLAL